MHAWILWRLQKAFTQILWEITWKQLPKYSENRKIENACLVLTSFWGVTEVSQESYNPQSYWRWNRAQWGRVWAALPLSLTEISRICTFRSRLGRRNEAPSALLSWFWPLGTENVEAKGSSPGWTCLLLCNCRQTWQLIPFYKTGLKNYQLSKDWFGALLSEKLKTSFQVPTPKHLSSSCVYWPFYPHWYWMFSRISLSSGTLCQLCSVGMDNEGVEIPLVRSSLHFPDASHAKEPIFLQCLLGFHHTATSSTPPVPSVHSRNLY